MDYDPSRYHYVIHDHEVIAISTYAGKTVRGVAKYNPDDVNAFDVEKGKALAAARCNAKVARRRQHRAERKYAEASEMFGKITKHRDEMLGYLSEATKAKEDAENAVNDILANL